MRFAAFIITFNRPSILAKTISVLLEQTIVPEKILIVDNSTNTQTRKLIAAQRDKRIDYHDNGGNRGPAGGAATGMKLLAQKGYDAILWLDDDDPPYDNALNEKFLQVLKNDSSIAVVGSLGAALNRWTGDIRRLEDHELRGDIVDVDYIGGNQHILARGEYIRQHGLWPEADLFFGFEDLDFCMKVKRAGYRVVAVPEVALVNRERAGRMNFKPATREEILRDGARTVWRQYYSYRSLIHIFLSNSLISAACFTALRGLFKVAYAFRISWSVGTLYFKSVLGGIADGASGKLGYTVPAVSKYPKENR